MSAQQTATVAPTGANLYARFALAGAICCGVTHGALTPVGKFPFSCSSGLICTDHDLCLDEESERDCQCANI